MKRFILSLTGLLALTLPVFADSVWQSSFSVINNLTTSLCTAGQGAMLHSVCVVDGVASSSAAVYNSSFTKNNTQNLSGTIDGSETGKGCFEFNVAAPNGLYVDRFGTAGYNVLYDCYSRN